MLGAGHLLKQVLGSAGAPAPCLVRGPAAAAACRLGHLSWTTPGFFHQQLSTAPRDDSSSEAAAGQQQQASASSSSTDQQQASSSDTGTGSSEAEAGTSSSSSSASGFSFSSFKSRFGGGGDSSSSSSSKQQEPLGRRAQQLWSTVQREVAAAVLPRQEHISVTRKYDGPTYQASPEDYSGSTAIAALPQRQTAWQALADRFGQHPLFSRLRGADLSANPLVKKTAALADDLREKYETSDHPAVHKVEDLKERLAGMSESAVAMAKIRARDPGFDMSRLLQGVRYDAPVVVKAFLTHDLASLGQHMGPELLERMAGIFKYYEEKGSYEDPTILFTGDPELVELKLIDEEPLLVVQFACQQVKATRDKFGNVIEGDPNAIQKVFYFWGLQQEEAGVVLPDGRVLPPRWVIKDMMWQSMLSLI